MRNHERRSARSGDLQYLGSKLSDHQVLIWKFNRLDKNKDKLLLSSEFLTSAMKKHLGTIKRGRKCSKKLLNDCDLDKDRGLSILEWTRCLSTSRRIMPLQWLVWAFGWWRLNEMISFNISQCSGTASCNCQATSWCSCAISWVPVLWTLKRDHTITVTDYFPNERKTFWCLFFATCAQMPASWDKT